MLMLTNGIGNLPSSQLLYVIAGYFVSTGTLSFPLTIIAGTLGNTLGNYITFLLVRKYEKPLAQKILFLDEKTFSKLHSALHATFHAQGIWWLFIGKLTPSVKAFVPVVAGLARTNKTFTAIIFFFASLLWAIGVTSLGYFFGEHISLKSFMGISLIVGGIILYIVYRNVSKKMSFEK